MDSFPRRVDDQFGCRLFHVLNAQNRLWTACRLMRELNGELNRTLSRELDMLGVNLGKKWETTSEFHVMVG